jgi:hypothetical protein
VVPTEEIKVFSSIDARELHDVGAGRAKADQMSGFIVRPILLFALHVQSC